MERTAATDAAILREEFVASLIAGDANLAEIIALDAVAAGMPVADLYVDVVGPALERLLLAAIGGESHVTGLRMIGDLAEGRGFDVRYLGAALPVETISSIVAKHEPEFVGLSVTMPGQAARLGAALDEVLLSGHAPRGILVGGRAVPEPVRSDARVRYAADAREAIELIEELADPV